MTILLDTHILVWLLNGSERIGEPVHAQIQQAADEDSLFISAITPWEIAMLVAKGRLRLGKDVEEWIRAALSLPGIRLEPLSPAIAVASTRLPWEVHPDPADRILLATARHLDATLVSIDGKMLDYGAQGFVRCIAPR
ncbi:MAG: type II toxin-antitoxin system VapC family toxin [Terracidiphilus sp.]|jgi:PIN domain nuclease of toxin-antitoxin system